MASRRSLSTTTAVAGGLLTAICFMPSASATAVHPDRSARPAGTAARPAGTRTAAARPAGAHPAAAAGLRLADTGSIDTTPYLVGGTAFLGMGAVLVLYSRRRALTLDLACDLAEPLA